MKNEAEISQRELQSRRKGIRALWLAGKAKD